MIEIGINSEILKQIIDGRKTIEGRLAKGKFLDIAIGDTLELREDVYVNGVITESRESAAKIEVTDVKKFGSFREMLAAEGSKELFRALQVSTRPVVSTRCTIRARMRIGMGC